MKKILLFITALLFFLTPEKILAQDFPVKVTAGSASRSRPVSKFIWGADYNGYYKYTSADEFINSIGDATTRLKNLGVTMLRYPGGCPSDVYNWKTNEMKDRAFNLLKPFLSVDEFLKLTDYLQAEPLYTININYKTGGNICGDIPRYPGLSPDQNKLTLIQDAVDLVHKYKGRIKYFELGNEQYLVGYTPEEYKAIALPIALAMKNEDPTIQIGITSFFDYSADHSGPGNSYWAPWFNMSRNIINSQCGTVACFDYVSTHDYFGIGYGPNVVPYAPLLKHRYGFDNAALDFAPKKLAMTEWNAGHCWQASAGKSSVFWGMFYEEMLLTMAEKGVFIANYHSITTDGQCNLIWPKTTDPWRSAEQVFSLSSVLAGGKILETNVDSPTQTISYKGIKTNVPYVTAHAGYSPDGTILYVFLLNHHQTQSANVSLDLSAVKTYVQGKIRVDQLSAASLTDYAFTQSTDTINAVNPLTINVPKNSIVRLTVAPRPSLCSLATISSSTLSSGNPITVTTTANKPVKNFFLAFYNLDNLFSPGNHKPIYFEAGKTFSISKTATNLTQTMSFTINYADIDKPDLNNNSQKPTNIQINGYFIDPTTGKTSLPDAHCVVQFKTPPGTVQGCKVLLGKGCYDSANAPFTLSSSPVSLDGINAINLGNNAPNSYLLRATSGSHTIRAAAPTGYNVIGYTLCYNKTDCHQNTPTPGSSVSVNVPAGGYTDLWWHFSAVSLTPTAIITTTNICPKKTQGDANCDGKINGVDYSMWLNHQCTSGCATVNLVADFNKDSKVNDNDYKIWFNYR